MFPDSFSRFEYFDINKAFDIGKVLTHIALTVDSNADDLLEIKEEIARLKKAEKRVEEDVTEIITKQGWRVIV